MTTQGGRDLPYDGEPGLRAVRCQARFPAGTVRNAAGRGFNPFSNPFQPRFKLPSKPLRTSVQPLPAGVADVRPRDTARPNLIRAAAGRERNRPRRFCPECRDGGLVEQIGPRGFIRTAARAPRRDSFQIAVRPQSFSQTYRRRSWRPMRFSGPDDAGGPLSPTLHAP